MAAKPEEVIQISAPPPPATAAAANLDTEQSQTVPPIQSKASIRRRTWIIVASIIIIFFAVDFVLFEILDHILFQVRTPQYRLDSVVVRNLRVGNSSSTNTTGGTASFDVQLTGEVTLRNRNFGSYSFSDNYLTFSYRDKPVELAVIYGTKVKARATKTMAFVLNVTSKAGARNSDLGRDIGSGSVKMTVFSDLRGQVRFLILYAKDKSSVLNCDLNVDFVKGTVEDLRCD